MKDCPEIPFAALELGTVIGTGGFGVVRRGQLGAGGRPIAVKIIDKEEISEADLQAFRDETAATCMLAHPNTVELLGRCTIPPKLAVVMELAEKGSLSSLLFSRDPAKRALLTSRIKARLALGAATGIAFLHENSVIHRDLKPENGGD